MVLWIVIAVVVIVVVLVVAGLLYEGSKASTSNTPAGNPAVTVDITAVNYQFVGTTSCWSDSTGQGGNENGGAQLTLSLDLTNNNLVTSCTVNSISLSTSGFSVVSSNAPLTVDAGSSQTLTAVIQLPDTSYAGALTAVVSVSSTL